MVFPDKLNNQSSHGSRLFETVTLTVTFLKKNSHMRRSLLILGLSLSIAVGGVLPATNPPWNPTYNLSMSTLTMQCNGSGFSSPQRGSAFGIVVSRSHENGRLRHIHSHTNCRVMIGAMQKQTGLCKVRWTVRNDC